MKKAKILKFKQPLIPGSNEIGTLLWAIMQPAIAGGITKKRAEEIFNEIMISIAELQGVDQEGKTAFQYLLDNILLKWYPEAMEKKH